MTRRWSDIAVTPGSLADARLPQPLAPRRFPLRPRSLAEALCAAGERLAAGGAAGGRGSDNWVRLFRGEPACLHAEILSFDAADAGYLFAEALECDPARAQVLIRALAGRVSAWIARIERDAPATYSKQLDQLDREAGLRTLLKRTCDDKPGALLSYAREHATVITAAKQHGALAEARAMRERLRSIHAVLRNAVTSLQASADAAFEARLRSGTIDPGLGLLIAELRAAAHVDAVIDRITDRHTMFYYSDIIGQTLAPPSPEIVLLGLDDVQRSGMLPHGAGLDARLADGTVQRFATEASVPLSPARIGELRLLSYATNEDISYHRALGGITGVRAASLLPTDLQGGAALSDGTLFGSGRDTPLALGLDIASPMLSLAEGTRRIEVSLHLARPSNLPARSHKLTREECAARDARMASATRDDAASGSGRRRAALSATADPEVRLALAADPELVAAFSTGKPETAIEGLTERITTVAERTGRTTSVGLIYEVLMEEVRGPAQLRLLLGRIVTLSLIEQHPFPSGEYWDRIYALVDRYRADLIGKTPPEPGSAEHVQNSMIFAAFSQRPDGTIDYPPEDVFQSLLGDAFDVTITTDAGPRRPDIMQVMPVRGKRAAGGITLSMRYDEAAPALTGPEHAPTLALRYAASARLCPVSFFEAYTIETVTISTRVTGLRRLVGFSDDAPVATDQTFQPFGPRPADGASFVVGCPEMARKPVTEIGIRLGWTGIPHALGGFARHYEGYGRNLELPDPKIAVDYLSGDGWKPVSPAPVPLFASDPVTGALQADWSFSGLVSGHSIAAQGAVTAQEFRSRQTVRAGLVRLRLSGTAGGFHAGRYPLALVEAMRPRLIPLGERRVPAAPFVPEIGHLTLSYRATATIELNAPETARPGEGLRQIGPFGHMPLFPHRQVKDARIFPRRMGYGYLAIQLTGPEATGPTAMTFSLAPSGHLRRIPEPNPLSWVYLTQNGWHRLPETAISSDTTAGLTRSGIVVLDLPEDAARDCPLMPPGGVWLAAVATRPDLGIFPALSGLRVNGVWARRSDDSWNEPGATRAWAFNPAQPGLASVAEIATGHRPRPPEAIDAFVARVGERLRHRHRGVTPWDMERMVLEAFPEVWMAKCLPHLDRSDPAPAPGCFTLVVVRKPPEEEAIATPSPALFDIATLQRIKRWLVGQITEEARLDVVNPTFERLQVRAKIAVRPDRENGAMAQMLRRDLARQLSVWTAPPTLRRFGWSLNLHMLRAHVAGLDYVRDVTDFSMLQLVGDDARSFELLDTAQGGDDPRGVYGPVLRPRFPWSLPLSTRDHVLTIVQDFEEETPTVAGIGSLVLGDMLVVGQRTNP